MHTHHTELELVPLITEYLLGRGEVKFARLPDLPSYFKGLALTQDAIGWRNFTEGKLSKTFRRVQESYLASADTNLTVDSLLDEGLHWEAIGDDPLSVDFPVHL